MDDFYLFRDEHARSNCIYGMKQHRIQQNDWIFMRIMHRTNIEQLLCTFFSLVHLIRLTFPSNLRYFSFYLSIVSHRLCMCIIHIDFHVHFLMMPNSIQLLESTSIFCFISAFVYNFLLFQFLIHTFLLEQDEQKRSSCKDVGGD